MNSCILITSHLNNSSKEEKAISQLEFFQNKGLPIIYVGNYPLSTKIQELSDFTLNTKENPQVNRMICYYFLVEEKILGPNKKAIGWNWDYGYAHLLQAYRGFKLAESLGYDHVMHFNYDMTLTEEEFAKLKNKILESPNLIFSWGKEEAYATNIYMMNTKDFIKMCDNKLHHYVTGDPPNIHRNDWYCEAYFKYMLDQSPEIEWVFNNNNEINPDQSHHHGGCYFNNQHFNGFYDPESDTLLLNSHYDCSNFPNSLNLKAEDGTLLKVTKHNSKDFSVPLKGKKGKLYEEGGGLVLDITKEFKSMNKIEPWG